MECVLDALSDSDSLSSMLRGSSGKGAFTSADDPFVSTRDGATDRLPPSAYRSPIPSPSKTLLPYVRTLKGPRVLSFTERLNPKLLIEDLGDTA